MGGEASRDGNNVGLKRGEQRETGPKKEETGEKGHICAQNRGHEFEPVCMNISKAGRIYTTNMPSESDGARPPAHQAHVRADVL